MICLHNKSNFMWWRIVEFILTNFYLFACLFVYLFPGKPFFVVCTHTLRESINQFSAQWREISRLLRQKLMYFRAKLRFVLRQTRSLNIGCVCLIYSFLALFISLSSNPYDNLIAIRCVNGASPNLPERHKNTKYHKKGCIP